MVPSGVGSFSFDYSYYVPTVWHVTASIYSRVSEPALKWYKPSVFKLDLTNCSDCQIVPQLRGVITSSGWILFEDIMC